MSRRRPRPPRPTRTHEEPGPKITGLRSAGRWLALGLALELRCAPMLPRVEQRTAPPPPPPVQVTAAPLPPPPSPMTLPASPRVERWRDEVHRAAIEAGVRLDELEAFDELVLAIIAVESSGDPRAIGDEGQSVGLFQLHERGEGYGLSLEERLSPATQFRVMVPKHLAAFRQGRARGLSGAELAVFVARRAQRPHRTRLPRYAAAYEAMVPPPARL